MPLDFRDFKDCMATILVGEPGPCELLAAESCFCERRLGVCATYYYSFLLAAQGLPRAHLPFVVEGHAGAFARSFGAF
jgi:hypothetical protein